MAREVKLTDPLPFLFYPDGERIFYLSPGPAVLLFAIEFKDIVRLNLISQQPVMQPTKHPFANVTGGIGLHAADLLPPTRTATAPAIAQAASARRPDQSCHPKTRYESAIEIGRAHV